MARQIIKRRERSGGPLRQPDEKLSFREGKVEEVIE